MTKNQKTMMNAWHPQVKKWLADDIGADPEIFEYLHFQTEAGRKLTVKIPFMSKPVELKMQFEQGLCYFDVLASKFEAELSTLFNKFDNVVLLDHAQLASLKRTIAPLLVEAIRDQKFSHPYPSHAIKGVLEIKNFIGKGASRLEVSPLALAGICADEYEKDLAPKVKQASVDLEAFLVATVSRYYKPIDFLVSLGLFVASQVFEPISGPLDVIDNFWVLLNDNEKKKFLKSAAISLKRSMTDDLKAYLIAKTEEIDKVSEFELKYQIKLEANAGALKNTNFKQYGQDLKESAIGMDLLDLIHLSYALQYAGGKESIKSRVAKIQSHLDHAALPAAQQEYMCKWERLYPYFKA